MNSFKPGDILESIFLGNSTAWVFIGEAGRAQVWVVEVPEEGETKRPIVVKLAGQYLRPRR